MTKLSVIISMTFALCAPAFSANETLSLLHCQATDAKHAEVNSIEISLEKGTPADLRVDTMVPGNIALDGEAALPVRVALATEGPHQVLISVDFKSGGKFEITAKGTSFNYGILSAGGEVLGAYRCKNSGNFHF